jgi:hypothetical protein
MPITAEEYDARLAAQRRTRVLAEVAEALAHELDVPPPVTEVRHSTTGTRPLLGVEALELARRVYYEGYGSFRDCARAIIEAGLCEDVTRHSQDPETVIGGRLLNWWRRERWPKRPTRHTFALRDAAHEGGLFRSERLCRGLATGSGPTPRGKPCRQSAMLDSDYCWLHDPRPEYDERRRRIGAHFAVRRAADMVPVAPFQDFLERERGRLLAEASARGSVHANMRGWRYVSAELGLDASIIGRIMQGTHNGAAMRTGKGVQGMIRAKTVRKYLAGAGVSFEDLYGFEPPVVSDLSTFACPRCGGSKNSASTMCRACFETRGTPCPYVNRHGRTCGILTEHPSGYCHKCRRTLSGAKRVKRPHKPPKVSLVEGPTSVLALDEYLRAPSFEWIACKLWAAGASSGYLDRRSLACGLSKFFATRGVDGSAPDFLARLVEHHGEPRWPARDPGLLLENLPFLVPFAPFHTWLRDCHAAVGGPARGSIKLLSGYVGMDYKTGQLGQWLRGVNGDGTPRMFVNRSIVERALSGWGDGTLLDLYLEA